MLYNKEWDKKNPISLLRCAADLIEEHGSAKYLLEVTAENADAHSSWRLPEPQRIGSMCVQGALMMAASGKTSWDGWTPEVREAILMMNKMLPSFVSVVVWNNSPDVTQEMIVSKLREVADANEKVAV